MSEHVALAHSTHIESLKKPKFSRSTDGLKRAFFAAFAIACGIAAADSALAACDPSKGGFVAGVLKCFDAAHAQTFDDWDHRNGQWGNPFDHGVALGCNGLAPGCGPAMEAEYKANRNGWVPAWQPGMMQPVVPPAQNSVSPAWSTGGIPVGSTGGVPLDTM
ncbi:hypothetical protein P3T40_007367 [Paraburkholderia sp. EB58]|uniref:hypothetical protein n=1 Tax=Paraburkholderia sp. EB58 TaxID=3035125 RepID=UPI003D21735C